MKERRNREVIDGKWEGGDPYKHDHGPPWASVIASLEALAQPCGWASLAAMKKAVLRSRGLG